MPSNYFTLSQSCHLSYFSFPSIFLALLLTFSHTSLGTLSSISLFTILVWNNDAAVASVGCLVILKGVEDDAI